MNNNLELYGPDMQQMLINSIFESDLVILFEKLADLNFNNEKMNKHFVSLLKERLHKFKFNSEISSINDDDLNTAFSIILEISSEFKKINHKTNNSLEFSSNPNFKGDYMAIPDKAYKKYQNFIENHPVIVVLTTLAIGLFKEPLDEKRLDLQKKIISSVTSLTITESKKQLHSNLSKETKQNQSESFELEDYHLKLDIFSQDED